MVGISPITFLSIAMLMLNQIYAVPSIIQASQRRAVNQSSVYSPVLLATADDFFSYFTAYTGPDPTHGSINYTDMNFAFEQAYLSKPFLSDFNASAARLSMDDTHVATGGRNSVRLSSKANFTVGSLFVLDVAHAPVAWGQWSSFWLLGQDGTWPSSGEIDIFESVHMNTANTITIHTASGCAVANDSNALGTLKQTDCNAGNAMEGCSTVVPASISVENTTIKTAGQPFNDMNGAIFVVEWTSAAISVWQFARSAVPVSLTTANPTTAGFPAPAAHFVGPGCAFDKSFREMQLIINVDACGDWAGNVWQASGAAAATGTTTCSEYVLKSPQAMKEAYFDFLSLAVYSSSATA